MRKLLFAVFSVAAIATLLVARPARATVPSSFTVQGVLRDAGGNLQSTMVEVSVSLYDQQTAGTKLAGTFGPTTVMATNGLFTVPINDSGLQLALAPATELWLEVTVGTDTFARQPVTPQIYALMCRTADSVKGLTILPDGKVGIGTAAPSRPVEIAYSSAAGGLAETGLKLANTTKTNATELNLDGARSWSIEVEGSVGAPAGGLAFVDYTAGATRLAITDSGRVGIGTTAPIMSLDVRGELGIGDMGGSNDVLFRNQTTATSPGFAIGIRGDVAGNNDDLKVLRFNGAGAFQDVPMMISQASGNVGIGTASPMGPLEVRVGADQNVLLRSFGGTADIAAVNDANGAYVPLKVEASQLQISSPSVSIGMPSSAGPLQVKVGTDQTLLFRVANSVPNISAVNENNSVALPLDLFASRIHLSTASVGIGTQTPGATLDVQTATPGLKVGATCVAGTCPSDRGLKKDIAYLTGALATIQRLKPASYRYKADERQLLGYGLIAQDVQEVAPQLVDRGADGNLRVNYSPLEMMLIAAVKEQQTRIDRMDAELRALQRRQK